MKLHILTVWDGIMTTQESKMSGTVITVKRGSEGPKYDPYSYVEITVYRLEREVVLHAGLTCWLEVQNEFGQSEHYDEFDTKKGEKDIFAKFFELTEMTPGDAEKYHERAKNRCPKCHSSKHVDIMGSGYVGETIYGCTRCNLGMYDNFQLSMIE